MNPQKIEFQRLRNFSQIINVTFEFIRQNFKQLFKAVIFFVGPFILLTGIFMGLYQKDVLMFSPTSTTLSQFGIAYLLFIIFLILTMIMMYAVVYSYILIYIKREDDLVIELDEIWQKVKNVLPRLLLFSFGYGAVVLLGVILLVIPGIYLSVALTILFIVALNENLSFMDSVKRCLFLIKNKWWNTLGVLMILGLIQGFLGFLFQIPQYIITFISAFNSIDGSQPSGTMEIFIIVSSIISSFSFAFYAISLTGIVFWYFSLVEQKEAKGLLEKIDSI